MGKVYLVGFMGVGKSTIGKKLAHKLDYSFIDLDDLFEEKYKISIHNFFHKYDENLFRKMEYELLLSTFDKNKVVISTGGGTPCFYDAMDMINKSGVSVYIKMLPTSIVYRLAAAKRKRPLVESLKKEELLNYVTKELKKRESVYQRARIHVNGLHINLDELVDDVKKEVNLLSH